MVESGTTITWEAWDMKCKPNQDWNHAWRTPRICCRVTCSACNRCAGVETDAHQTAPRPALIRRRRSPHATRAGAGGLEAPPGFHALAHVAHGDDGPSRVARHGRRETSPRQQSAGRRKFLAVIPNRGPSLMFHSSAIQSSGRSYHSGRRAGSPDAAFGAVRGRRVGWRRPGMAVIGRMPEADKRPDPQPVEARFAIVHSIPRPEAIGAVIPHAVMNERAAGIAPDRARPASFCRARCCRR